MKVALICNKNGRMPLGKIYIDVLKDYKNVEVSHFSLEEIQKVKGGFDLYLRLGDDGYQSIPKRLHPVAWWTNDTHLKKCYKKIKNIAPNYDFIFCAQKEGAKRLAQDIKRETFWVPWATCEASSSFEFKKNNEKEWNVCFVGTTGKYSLRKVMLETIKLNYPNSFIGRGRYWQLRDCYSKARIVVNYSINNDINPRIYEGLGAGSLVLTHRINNNGFNEIFEEKKHLVVYDDIFTDMKDKIDYYLENVKEREKIAQAGFKYVNKNHTYRHRTEQMFNIMGYQLKE